MEMLFRLHVYMNGSLIPFLPELLIGLSKTSSSRSICVLTNTSFFIDS